MSYSLHIRNGDLNLGGVGGLAVVTGSQKLVQDLRDWILEPRGTDASHPDFGSMIDGQVMPDGTMVESIIGSTIDSFMILNLESELRRVIGAYQQQQMDRLQYEVNLYNGKHTFAAGELISSVNSVDITQAGDVLIATISLTASNGSDITLTTPISGANAG